ncbi:uncharacterized protein LOC121729479 [Aricia agestis]|uniref:uncharacterized protein LOC121729479 n=1 Tax=Aricia agestis TaxID=91739 RepID=UPI001C2043B3|nr:uncharacterized protein LOC121729479 [Aricia agestis]
MIAIVIRGIRDPHIKACATNAKLTIDNMVDFLSTFTKPTSKSLPMSSFSQQSRHKSTFKRILKCFICGDTQHKQVNCPKKPKQKTNSQILALPSSSDNSSKSNLSCAYCKKGGHDITSCFAKQRSDAQRNKNKVNFCSTPDFSKNNDVMVGIIQGIPVDILIDSGALDVSLISSDVVNHFSCCKKPINSQLKGISDTTIFVEFYVTLTIEFPEITLEVDLLIVPRECMNAPIIIGTDVLNRDGVTYVRTRSLQRLTRGLSVNRVCNVQANIECNEIKTTLVGDDLKVLLSILDKFSKFMISGTAMTTVTTGKMQIRLNNDTPIYYRPYKMSFNEKLKVRDIIKDLLSKNIIRESESPYSSPVLLVKKKDGSDRMCVDFRALNKITVKDRYPLPLIDDHLDRLGKAKLFTTLDMATGFHQIMFVATVNNITKPRNWAQIAQSGDEETQQLLRSLDEGQLDASRYVKKGDLFS